MANDIKYAEAEIRTILRTGRNSKHYEKLDDMLEEIRQYYENNTVFVYFYFATLIRWLKKYHKDIYKEFLENADLHLS